MGGQIEAGIEADRAYNGLAIRYVAMLELYECIREAIKAENYEVCQDKIK